MFSSERTHWSGIIFILGGSLFLLSTLGAKLFPADAAAPIWSMTNPTLSSVYQLLRALALLCLSAGVLVWLPSIVASIGRLARVVMLLTGLAALMMLLSLFSVYILNRDAGWPLFVTGVLVQLAALVLLGWLTLRATLLGRWKHLPLLMGLLGLGWFCANPSAGSGYAASVDLLRFVLALLFAGAWFLLGSVLLTGPNAAEPHSIQTTE